MAFSCPACRKPMEKTLFKSVDVHRCAACEGLWFDIYKLAEAARCPLPPVTGVGKTNRECPSCEVPMQVARMKPVDVERCGSCNGTFLDGGEFRELRRGRPPQPMEMEPSSSSEGVAVQATMEGLTWLLWILD